LAARDQLRLHCDAAIGLLLADFHQTHAATCDDTQRRMPTIMRNLRADALRSLHAVDLLINAKLKRRVVNVNGWHKLRCREHGAGSLESDSYSTLPAPCSTLLMRHHQLLRRRHRPP